MNTQPAEQVSKAQYNGGSALQDELLDEGGVYSTPYRTYDPALGRFQGVDMLADAYASQTPYQFAGNDPANANDPTGAMVFENGRMVIDDNRGPTSFGFNSSYSYNRDGAAFGGVFHDNGGNLGISIGNFDNMLNFHQNNLDTYEKNKYISIDIYKYVSKESSMNPPGTPLLQVTLAPTVARLLALLEAIVIVKEVHANSDKRLDRWHVYVIQSGTQIPGHDWLKAGTERIEKYGITHGSGSDAEERPKYQVNRFNRELSPITNRYYNYFWVETDLKTRTQAKLLEKFYVSKYFIQNNYSMPPLQQRPKADISQWW